MSNLLAWAIENQAPEETVTMEDPNAVTQKRRELTQDDLRALMGGPSDADLMKQAIGVILHPEADHEARITAFDNFEQLIENLDNANNIEPLGLWKPLLTLLEHDDAELRKMAAWCVGTAVQNNEKSQQFLLGHGGVSIVAKMAIDDKDNAARRKAIYALSSSVRNFQPGMDEASKVLPSNVTGPDQVNANDMDVIDAIMAKLRET